ncbi:MAG TPA: thiamine phosphate synthase [Kaistiaceae bacterium]|nr:thiamine phosphate synthase [Kaistiaceae bacterium]
MAKDKKKTAGAAAPVAEEYHRPRLYLVTPRKIDPAAFLPALEAALGAGDVAAVLIHCETSGETELQQIAEALTPPVQARGAAVVLAGDSRIVGRAKADGIHIAEGREALADAVDRLQRQGFIVGAGNLKTRHEAMEAGEAGADYVFFGMLDKPEAAEIHDKTVALGEWWAAMFEPAAVVLSGADIASVTDAARTGADFIALRAAVWDHPDGPAAAVAAAERLIDEAAAEAR